MPQDGLTPQPMPFAIDPAATPGPRPDGPKILLSAFGIHIGGGLVLLESLLGEAMPYLRAAALDARLPGPGPSQHGPVAIDSVPPRVLSRASSLRRLAAQARAGDTLFCFNGLPPFSKPRGVRVVSYVQAPYLVDRSRGIQYPPRVRARQMLERAWFAQGARHCDEFWVQTRSMAHSLGRAQGADRVRVMPFVDEDLQRALGAQAALAMPNGEDSTFFFPAELAGHKNHVTLVRAWRELARGGCRPLLLLTLQPGEWERLALDVGGLDDAGPVRNLGRLARAEVLRTLKQSSALVFPSKAETFGLPLIEARALGVPILASERDFVRDVCAPRQTFDPESPRSIADAVVRFLRGDTAPPLPTLTAAQIVRALLA